MARRIVKEIVRGPELYLNWDYPQHRKAIRSLDWPRSAPVVVLDEIHKYRQWKSLLKGFFDVEGHSQRILVTGSARLDIYTKGGDSLMGRAYHYRLHPLSLSEVMRQGMPPAADLLEPESWINPTGRAGQDTFGQLFVLGGFPEPFLNGDDQKARRWRINRREHVLREDLRDLSLIRDIGRVEYLLDLLIDRVGSPISVNSLREDLEVDHKTVVSWIEMLGRLHLVFQLMPYGHKIQRGIKKAKKIYFWDWSEVPDHNARFENLIAVHLLKMCHYLQDVEGVSAELRYVRDRNKREVDFLLLKDRRPWVLIEAKTAETKESRNLVHFAAQLGVKHRYQVTMRPYQGCHVVPCWNFLGGLP